ncbi:MAG: hypothetical protein ACR2ND_03470 [Solirubrobacteraceae bacterium]
MRSISPRTLAVPTILARAALGTPALAARGTAAKRSCATVGGETGYSSSGVVPLAAWNSRQAPCGAGELQVQTFNETASGPVASDGAGFSIVVP